VNSFCSDRRIDSIAKRREERSDVAIIITVDVEPDNVWAEPGSRSTKNAGCLARFHEFCTRYKFPVTYLATWEMATSTEFVWFARDVIASATGEIGLHPHAWTNPPNSTIPANERVKPSFMGEYPKEVIARKVRMLKTQLENAVGVEIKVHRAGRWALSEDYLDVLIESGIEVDCSVTPGVNWRFTRGGKYWAGGPDYSRAPTGPFLIRHSSGGAVHGAIVEIPMTTRIDKGGDTWLLRMFDRISPWLPPIGRLGALRPARISWLRPSHNTGDGLLQLAERCIEEGDMHLEVMLHSSEFLAGANPYFKDEIAVDQAYSRLAKLFDGLSGRVRGSTLSEFAAPYRRR
jgi:hypothetical protein